MTAAPDWASVLALVEQLDQSGLEEAEIVADGVTVRVSRTPGGLAAVPAAAPAPAAPSPAAGPSPAAAPHPAAGPAVPAAGGRGDLIEVTAPIIGTAYLRPAPGRPAFVAVGDVVGPDTSVAIIEVMKMMNTVTAGASGRVAQIAVEDGAMVEHGDVLLRLEPA